MITEQMIGHARLGAVYEGDTRACVFTVWAPFRKSLSVRIESAGNKVVPMERDGWGYWTAFIPGLSPGDRYYFNLDGKTDRPDPASRFQPDGVHAASAVVDPGFPWSDGSWKGIPLRDFVIYELHIGTFTQAGTFDAAVDRLDSLKELGITALELMPVAQFPGTRNWGYDGVYQYAPQNSYGGPIGLKNLVNEAHARGLAVILDVVYNHLGPEGNYLNDYGPYFTPRYKTPWGDALNFDGAYSDDVRKYFIENALYWLTDYHIDALRLDAVDTIYDFGARHILADLADAVHEQGRQLGRNVFLIAESDLNDVRIVNPPGLGGYGIDAQWSDDFHHALHALLTGERKGYYQDFGTITHVEKAFRDGFVNAGTYSAYRKRRHGNSSRHIPKRRFVVCSQNHDQVGNRMLGERLSTITGFEQHKLAAACVVLSPFLPLLFMGEEYAETAPFQYFVSHISDELVTSVRRGRALEFSRFEWDGTVPDPQAEETFLRSKINPALRFNSRHALMYRYYRNLIHIRKTDPLVSGLDVNPVEVTPYGDVLVLKTGARDRQAAILYSFNPEPARLSVPAAKGKWEKTFDSSSKEWGGPALGPEQTLLSDGGLRVVLHPFSAVMYSLQIEG